MTQASLIIRNMPGSILLAFTTGITVTITVFTCLTHGPTLIANIDIAVSVFLLRTVLIRYMDIRAVTVLVAEEVKRLIKEDEEK